MEEIDKYTVSNKAVIAESINSGKFTLEEEEILRLTEEVWNRFSELPINHPMEMNENRTIIRGRR